MWCCHVGIRHRTANFAQLVEDKLKEIRQRPARSLHNVAPRVRREVHTIRSCELNEKCVGGGWVKRVQRDDEEVVDGIADSQSPGYGIEAD